MSYLELSLHITLEWNKVTLNTTQKNHTTVHLQKHSSLCLSLSLYSVQKQVLKWEAEMLCENQSFNPLQEQVK